MFSLAQYELVKPTKGRKPPRIREQAMFNKKKLVIFLIIVFIILPSTVSLLNLYTDWLFFKEIGLTPVFTTTLGAKIGTGAFFGALMLLFTLANLLYACRAN